ncbi:MAG TPA: glucokinase [Anaerolineae bacterium]|nr:glucokinase [Anaerolineae bacterium]HOR01054.1 glucokinase [Anaerolineae bacterium]HPL27093.1 glucokinase [Anaerolineae bacterium]
MILAGDIGGTKTSLSLASVAEDGSVRLAEVHSYPSQQYASLEAIVERFGQEVSATVDRACFGVAGPVLAGEATITNLPWRMSERSLTEALGGLPSRLINDLTALAHAVPALRGEDLVTLQRGERQVGGAIAILAPGTGLGQGYLCWDGRRYRPGASEGGHADFAPADDLQIQLLQFLRAEYGHVSWERVLAGPGLHNIHRFLCAAGAATPDWVAARLAAGDPSAAISALALTGEDPCCARALDIFVSIMGAQAGNLALTYMATGGVYLGGGIPPKILPKLQDGAFLRAFRAKGRLSPVAAAIPVAVIANAQAGLLGAAACALEHASSHVAPPPARFFGSH